MRLSRTNPASVSRFNLPLPDPGPWKEGRNQEEGKSRLLHLVLASSFPFTRTTTYPPTYLPILGTLDKVLVRSNIELLPVTGTQYLKR